MWFRNCLKVSVFLTVSAIRATLGCLHGVSVKVWRAILIVPTNAGITEGSKAWFNNIIDISHKKKGWHKLRLHPIWYRVRSSDESRPWTLKGFQGLLMQTNQAWDNSNPDETKMRLCMIKKLKFTRWVDEGEYSLQGRLRLSRQRLKTSSLRSVSQREPGDRSVNRIFERLTLFKSCCRDATIIPRKPTPEPSSKTRLDIINSDYKVTSTSRKSSEKFIKYRGAWWGTEKAHSSQTMSWNQWCHFQS